MRLDRSPLPLQANSAVDRPAIVTAAFDTFFAACAADAACDRAYPNLRQVFYDTVDALDQAPVQRGSGPNGKTYITGERSMAAVFERLGSPAQDATRERRIRQDLRVGRLFPLRLARQLDLGAHRAPFC